MDHHCPWINNCVGHYNYGHFVRFVTWVTITTGACMALLCARIYDAIKYERYYMVRKQKAYIRVLSVCKRNQPFFFPALHSLCPRSLDWNYRYMLVPRRRSNDKRDSILGAEHLCGWRRLACRRHLVHIPSVEHDEQHFNHRGLGKGKGRGHDQEGQDSKGKQTITSLGE